MPYDQKKHHRRSIRLKGFDYAGEGAYFITVCAHDRECLFGSVVDGVMRLNAFGKIVHDEWLQTAVIRPNIILDEFVVMPNHLHGIIVIERRVGNDDAVRDVRGGVCRGVCRGVLQYAPTSMQYAPTSAATSSAITQTQNTMRSPLFHSPSQTIGSIIRGFKSSTTTDVNQLRATFGTSIWQRNYYERVIRDEAELNRIRDYIRNNPLKWERDRNNIENILM